MNCHRLICPAVIAFAALTGLGASAEVACAGKATVFAAASLKNALDEVAALFADGTGICLTINYAGSPALARQIEQAAPADVFFSGDLDWMDYLEARGFVDRQSRVTLLGNALVLVAPRDSAAAIRIAPNMPLADLLGDGRLAMASVDTVPAGRYGKASLEHLGVWHSVADRIVETDNVRNALAFVARGETPLGIVYATDAAAEPRVRIVDTFPSGSHPPICYPVALTGAADNADAGRFLDFLQSDAAGAIFEKHGFAFLAAGARP